MTAAKAIEKRIGNLLDATGTKKQIRADLCAWFNTFLQSDEFKRLPEAERINSIDRFTGLLKFFV